MTTNRPRMGHAKINTSTAATKSSFSSMDHMGSSARDVWNLWIHLLSAIPRRADRAMESAFSAEATSFYVGDHAVPVASFAKESFHGKPPYSAAGDDHRESDQYADGCAECDFMGSYRECSHLWVNSGV